MANVGYHIRNGWLQKPPLGVQLNHAHPLTKGLVGCWLFNEGGGDKAYDLSGYNNHGTLENMAFPPTSTSGWNPGKDGVGLMFNGTSNYVNCNHNPSVNPTDAMTIEMWVNPKSLTNSDGIIDKYVVVAGSRSFRLFVDSDVTKLILQVSGDGTNNEVQKASFGLVVNVWQHITLTYNAGIFNAYKNGQSVPVDGDFLVTSIHQSSTNLIIGNRQADNYYFNGTVDGVKLYNRALTAFEIGGSYRESYAMFEPATKYTIIDERLRTKHVGSNVAAMQMLRGRTGI